MNSLALPSVFTLDSRPGPAYLRVEAPPSLTAGFTLRPGGVSRSSFAEANFSFQVGDDPAAVRANRAALLAKIAGSGAFRHLVTVRQVHSCGIWAITAGTAAAALAEGGKREADAIITTRPGTLVAIQTADCLPLIFLAAAPRLVAVVHAGWRGLAAGIAVRVLERLDKEFGIAPNALKIFAGPAIGPCCFVVGPEVLAVFRKLVCLAGEGGWWRRNGAGVFLDLVEIQRLQLRAAGVPAGAFQAVGICTACNDFCFSYRRDRAISGRQLAFAGIGENSAI